MPKNQGFGGLWHTAAIEISQIIAKKLFGFYIIKSSKIKLLRVANMAIVLIRQKAVI